MIKVGIIEPVGSHGGNDVYNNSLAKTIAKNEKMDVVIYSSDSIEESSNIKSKSFFKNVYNQQILLKKIFKYIFGILKSMIDAKTRRVDIIHLHFFGFSLLDYFNLLIAKYIFRFKVVGTMHDIKSFADFGNKNNIINFQWWRKVNISNFIQKLDGIIVHTDYAKKTVLDKAKKYNFKTLNLARIYGADFDYSSLKNNKKDILKSRNRVNFPHNKKIILFFGQIKKVKNLLVVLKALKIVKKIRKDFYLIIAGKVWRDDILSYEKFISENKLKQYIDLRPEFVNNNDVPYYFNGSDIIIIPYKKIYNSGVLIRSMSYSKTIIASDLFPFKEFIENNVNGFLFKNDNHDDLAKQLIQILDYDQEKLERIGYLAKESLQLKFKINDISNQYFNFYKKINDKK